MPLLSRYMIRSSFFNLWVGFGFATLILSHKGLPEVFPAYTWQWIPAHVNLLLVGWMVQFALGVAYWIFPRLFDQLTERGRKPVVILSTIFLNLGVWLHVLAGLISPWDNSLIVLRSVGLLLQLLAVILFAYHAYPRVRPTFVSQNSG